MNNDRFIIQTLAQEVLSSGKIELCNTSVYRNHDAKLWEVNHSGKIINFDSLDTAIIRMILIIGFDCILRELKTGNF
jgi:hypothetical protein